jgi:hypothetical protein
MSRARVDARLRVTLAGPLPGVTGRVASRNRSIAIAPHDVSLRLKACQLELTSVRERTDTA